MKTAKAKRRTTEPIREAKPAACQGCPIACEPATKGSAPAKTGDPRCRGCPAACCRTCAYAGKVRDGRRTLLVCVNHPEAPGLMRKVAPKTVCRNYRPRQIRAGRRKRSKSPPDEVRYIALTQGRFATVDARDYDRLARDRWFAVRQEGRYYARRNAKGRAVYMHREITRAPKGMVVDHRDNNGVSNCRVNLRVCTQQENSYNSRPHGSSSMYKGVSYLADLRVWQAAICTKNRMWPIGCFKSELAAARAYDREARRRFGPYAWLNFPEEADTEPAKVKKRRRPVKKCTRLKI